MGLLDQLGGMLGQGGGSDAIGAIGNLIEQHGGLDGLVQQLQNGGLSDIVASWVGTGANLPVSADALQQALGSDRIGQIAASLGLSTDQAAGSLAQLLPQVVDQLTPNGSIEGGGLLEQGLGLLKGKLFG
ncbi:MAG: YidB family protein [Chitinivorax sp.]